MGKRKLKLFHGTVDIYANEIFTGIDLTRCRALTDFGAGFYTTTVRHQALEWAKVKALAINVGGSRIKPVQPCVVTFEVDEEKIGKLRTLCFVRSHYTANHFWSFVKRCRTGAKNHNISSPTGFYDMVFGPVAAFWQQKCAMQDSDQISFHTTEAIKMLTWKTSENI